MIGLGQLVLEMFGAQCRAKPGPQFPGFKGFGEVIHGPQFKSPQFVGRAVPGGKHDNGDRAFQRLFPELTEDFKPIHSRQAKVKQHQIEMVFAHHAQCLLRVGGVGQRDIVLVQKSGQHLMHLGVILDQ